jgi:hypothetical protein
VSRGVCWGCWEEVAGRRRACVRCMSAPP